MEKTPKDYKRKNQMKKIKTIKRIPQHIHIENDYDRLINPKEYLEALLEIVRKCRLTEVEYKDIESEISSVQHYLSGNRLWRGIIRPNQTNTSKVFYVSSKYLKQLNKLWKKKK